MSRTETQSIKMSRQPIPAGHVGERIALLRGRRGLLQRELAEKSTLSMDSIRRIEQGKFTPRPDTLERIAKALGTSTAYLSTPIDYCPTCGHLVTKADTPS